MSSQVPTLGILGGGQLARMTAYAAFRLGMRVYIMEKFPGSPAGEIAHKEVVGKPEDHDLLVRFASGCNVVTLESEFIDERHLLKIERSGNVLYPTATSVAHIQDKLVQKRTLEEAGIPVTPFAAVDSVDEARAFGEQHCYPFVLKSRRGGYDGYGNATIESSSAIETGWEAIAGGRSDSELYAEAFVSFDRELAVMVVRSVSGALERYPVVETVQRNHICHLVMAPARVSDDARDRVVDCARRAVEAIEGVGVFGIEFFLCSDGTVLLNEMAPRPHNSGHYTIEGCVTSQFENHIRAIMDWPLGSTALRAPAVSMANILGDAEAPGVVSDYARVLSDPRAHLHIYGKADSRVGRKMGHVTVLGETVEQTLESAQRTADRVRFG